MVLEPRAVAPGFMRRWTGEACELMTRSFHLWFGVAVLFCLASVLLGPIQPLFMIPIGLFFYFTSVEFAAASDEWEVRVADVPALLRTAALGVIKDIWAKRFVMVFLVIVMLYSFYLDKDLAQRAAASAAKAPPADLSNVMTWLVGPASPLVYATLYLLFGAMLQGQTFALANLTYPLMRAFDLEDARMRDLLYKALFKNLMPALFLHVGPLSLLVVIGFTLPILVPFLMCFLPALSYVAYREIFIDGNGNRKQSKITERKLASQGAA